MALAKALRDEVRKKLNGISDRQLYNKIGEKTIEAGVADHDDNAMSEAPALLQPVANER